MAEGNALFEQLKTIATEQRNPASMDIDARSFSEIVRIINDEDKKVALAVETQLDHISKAVELVVRAFKAGGRLLYVGAGISGRLGVLDAAECPPTYGTDPNLVQGIIAGGKEAMFKAQEGAEDKQEDLYISGGAADAPHGWIGWHGACNLLNIRIEAKL